MLFRSECFDHDTLDVSEIELDISIEHRWQASLKYLKVTEGTRSNPREVSFYSGMTRLFKLVGWSTEAELSYLDSLTTSPSASTPSLESTKHLSPHPAQSFHTPTPSPFFPGRARAPFGTAWESATNNRHPLPCQRKVRNKS